MKKFNWIPNVIRLIIAILLVATVFIPCVSLRLNTISYDQAEKLIIAATAAYKDKLISEKDYEEITQKLILSQLELKAIEQGTLDTFDEKGNTENSKQLLFSLIGEGEISNKVLYKDEEEILAMGFQNEFGNIEYRYQYTHSLFSILAALPDTITLLKDMNSDSYSPEAITVGSVDMVVLFHSTFADNHAILFNLLALILVVFCLFIAPILFTVFFIKEIACLCKQKGEYLKSKADIEILCPPLRYLAFSVILPVFLRGSKLQPIFLIVALLAVIYFVSATVIASDKKYASNIIVKKKEQTFLAASKVIFVAILILGSVILVLLTKYNPNDMGTVYNENIYEKALESAWQEEYSYLTTNQEAFNNSLLSEDETAALKIMANVHYTAKTDVIVSDGVFFTVRSFVAICIVFMIVYMVSSLRRLAEIEENIFVFSKYIRFIFCVFLTYIISFFNPQYTILMVLFIFIFLIEIIYAVYRNKSISRIKKEIITDAIARGKALADEGKISQERHVEFEESINRLAKSKLLVPIWISSLNDIVNDLLEDNQAET